MQHSPSPHRSAPLARTAGYAIKDGCLSLSNLYSAIVLFCFPFLFLLSGVPTLPSLTHLFPPLCPSRTRSADVAPLFEMTAALTSRLHNM